MLTLTLFSTACKKEEDKKTSKKDLLTAHNWRRTAMLYNGVYTYTQECENDDVVSFWSSGVYFFDVGTVLCSPTQTGQNSTWSLSSDESTLTISSANYTFEVTNDSLKFTGNGFTFIHAAIK